MYWFIWSSLVIFFLVIQTVFGNILSCAGIKPDILLVIIVFFAFKTAYFESGIMGFSCGILEECLAGNTMGTLTFSKTVVALLINLLKKLYPPKLIPIGLAILMATLVNNFIISIIYSFFSHCPDILTLIKRITIEGSYNLLIGVLLFPLLSKLKWRGEK